MHPPTSTAEWNPHGAIIYTRGGEILQAIGIPAPEGFIVAIPKYAPCSRLDTPWSRASGRYCRIIREYGPRGVREAWEKFSAEQGQARLEAYDGVYAASMPYVRLCDAIEIINPRRALAEALASGQEAVVQATVLILSGAGVSVEDAGLTGSYAAGIASPKISDVDLIVYGPQSALRMHDYFKSLKPAEGRRSSFGGVRVQPPLETLWRRARVSEDLVASWVGVPERVAGHCPPLRGYPNIDPPSGRIVKLRVKVEPGQEAALLYPPCVEAGGVYLVSFEYNLGEILYEGGILEVEAVESISGGTVYLGLREVPGVIKRAK